MVCVVSTTNSTVAASADRSSSDIPSSSIAQRDHEPWRSGVSAERRNSWEQQPAALCRDAATAVRFMESLLWFLRMHWDHEPPPPFGHPLPLGGGEGGVRGVHGENRGKKSGKPHKRFAGHLKKSW